MNGEWESEVVFTPRDRVLSIGKAGTGKSTRMKAALAKAMAAGQRVLAFDPLDEYSQHGRKRNSVVLGPLTHRLTTDELADELARGNDPLISDGLALAVVPVSKDPREWAADFSALVEEVEEVGDLVLCADELNVWGEYAPDSVKRTACLSRHWGDDGVPVLFGSQRAVGIHPTARAQATQILSGLQDLPADTDALAERCGQQFADEVSRLQPGEFRMWRDTNHKPGHARKGKKP